MFQRFMQAGHEVVMLKVVNNVNKDSIQNA